MAQVTYTKMYDAVSALHRKHYPVRNDAEYFEAVVADIHSALDTLNHHPYAQELFLAMYSELDRVAKGKS